MSDVELLERAIDRLEDLTAESTPGAWLRGHSSIGSRYVSESEFVATCVVLDEGLTDGDADLIVALHETIPALLAILKEALTQAILEESYPLYWYAPAAEESVALARAILGESE